MQKFKILWFDDIEANVDIHRQELQDFLLGKKRDLVIEYRVTYDENVLNDIMDYEYSLIVTDLNLLGSDKMGNEIINLLRAKSIFAETLLYSNNPKLLIEKTEGENFIEGLHRHAGLTGLGQKIKEMIEMCLCKEAYHENRMNDYQKENE